MSVSKVYSVHAQPDWMDTLLSLRSNATEEEQSIDVPGYSGEVLRMRAPAKSYSSCNIWLNITSVNKLDMSDMHTIDAEVHVQCISHNPMLPLEERYLLSCGICSVEWVGVCMRVYKESEKNMQFDCLLRPCSIFKTPHTLQLKPTFESVLSKEEEEETSHVWNFERAVHPMTDTVEESERALLALKSLGLKGKQSLSETTCIAVGQYGASGSELDQRVWDLATYQVRKVIPMVYPTKQQWISSNVLCAGGLDGSVQIIATESGVIAKSYHSGFGRVTGLVFSGRTVLSTHSQGALCVWSTDGKVENTIYGPGNGTTMYLGVTVHEEIYYCIHTYGIDRYYQHTPQEQPMDTIKSIRRIQAYTVYQDRIYYGDEEGYIYVYHILTKEQHLVGRVSKEGITQLYILDEDTLLITSDLHEVQKYKLENNTIVQCIECLARVDETITDICVQNNKIYLAGKEGIFVFE